MECIENIFTIPGGLTGFGVGWLSIEFSSWMKTSSSFSRTDSGAFSVNILKINSPSSPASNVDGIMQ